MRVRHRYNQEPGDEGMCICGQGRGEDVHNLMVWHKAPNGSWVGDLRGNVVYRCRPSNPYGKGWGKVSVWWPEYATVDDEARTRIGDEHGKSLAEAKQMCERHREENES